MADLTLLDASPASAFRSKKVWAFVCAKQRNNATTKNAPKMLATFGRGPPIPSRFIGGSVRHYSKHFNGFAAKN